MNNSRDRDLCWESQALVFEILPCFKLYLGLRICAVSPGRRGGLRVGAAITGKGETGLSGGCVLSVGGGRGVVWKSTVVTVIF